MGDRAQAVAFFNLAVEIMPRDPGVGVRLIGSSVVADPSFAEGWFQVGNYNADAGQTRGAVAAYRRAIEADPTLAKCWSNLGWQLYDLAELDEARVCCERAMSLDAGLSAPWINLSRIECVQGNHDEALRLARWAMEIDPGHIAEMNLAFASLFAARWADGFRHMEARYEHKLREYLNWPWPKWAGEALPRGTLYLVSEQGIGDAMRMSRFVPAAAARVGRVIMAVQPELVKLFTAMFGFIRNIEVRPLPQPFPVADAWNTIYGLPHALGLSGADIETRGNVRVGPFKCPPGWKAAATDRKLHVGISWAGSPLNGIDKWRTMGLENFLPFAAIPGVQLYGLQVGERSQDIQKMGLGSLIRDLSPGIQDVTDTMGIMGGLDLVVCAEGSLSHMASLIGKECWIMYSYMGGDWQAGRNREQQLWAPKSWIFRQSSAGAGWGPVVERVAAALREKMGLSA